MGKKSIGRHDAKPLFRESDFAGRPPQEQAELSGALNQLGHQLVATRKLLVELREPSAPVALIEPREAPGPAPFVDTGGHEHAAADGSNLPL